MSGVIPKFFTKCLRKGSSTEKQTKSERPWKNLQGTKTRLTPQPQTQEYPVIPHQTPEDVNIQSPKNKEIRHLLHNRKKFQYLLQKI